MNIEKFLELILNNPDNIKVEYSYINGKEKLLINGKEIESSNQIEKFDDSTIKERINKYKEAIEKLDDNIFEKILDTAELKGYNLHEMNNILELDSYNEEQSITANEVIDVITTLIGEVICDEIDRLEECYDSFSNYLK